MNATAAANAAAQTMFLIVRCCQCGHFSVKAETKSPKWACKLCGAKQAQARVYSSAAKAADLRPLVQEYNMKRGEYEETQKQVAMNVQNAIVEAIQSVADDEAKPAVNEWDQFVEKRQGNDDADDTSNDEAVKLRNTAHVSVDKPRAQKKRSAAATKNDTDSNDNDQTSQTIKSQRLVEPR
jgi:ribosomal protein S27E